MFRRAVIAILVLLALAMGLLWWWSHSFGPQWWHGSYIVRLSSQRCLHVTSFEGWLRLGDLWYSPGLPPSDDLETWDMLGGALIMPGPHPGQGSWPTPTFSNLGGLICPYEFVMVMPDMRVAGVAFPHWVVCVAALIYPIAVLVRRLVARRRRPGHCVKCGYDLRGLPEPRCPECGTGFDLRERPAVGES